MINTDTTFLVSRRAVWRLNIEAKKRQCSLGYLFRGWAYGVANTEHPKFDLSGQPLERTFSVGLNERVYTALVSVSEQFSVPIECIGELVCSYVEEDTSTPLVVRPTGCA